MTHAMATGTPPPRPIASPTTAPVDSAGDAAASAPAPPSPEAAAASPDGASLFRRLHARLRSDAAAQTTLLALLSEPSGAGTAAAGHGLHALAAGVLHGCAAVRRGAAGVLRLLEEEHGGWPAARLAMEMLNPALRRAYERQATEDEAEGRAAAAAAAVG